MPIKIEGFNHCEWATSIFHNDSRCEYLNKNNTRCLKYDKKLIEDEGTDPWTCRDGFSVLRCDECKSEYPRGE